MTHDTFVPLSKKTEGGAGLSIRNITCFSVSIRNHQVRLHVDVRSKTLT